MADVMLKGISKQLGSSEIIHDLSLDIKDGEFVTLLGPSGCGKTTLLRMIAGLESIDKGDLYINGRRCNNDPAQARKIAMVFQSYALFPHMTVADNIRFGLTISKVPKDEIRTRLEWAIGMLKLSGLEKRLPRHLSGGQRQRVALARALVLKPAVLLLDEPLSNLDTALRELAMEELKRIHHQVKSTIIYVTHNQVEAMSMSQRIAVLRAGSIEQYDTPRAVYDFPSTIFSASFIGSPAMNLIDGVIAVRNEDVGIDTALGFIRIDSDRGTLVRAMNGRPVRMGIRPQNVSYVEHHESRRASDTIIDLEIELVESLGDRSLVVARGQNNITIRFLVMRDISLEPQQKVPVFFDGRRLHLFDMQTNGNIFPAIDFTGE